MKVLLISNPPVMMDRNDERFEETTLPINITFSSEYHTDGHRLIV